MDVNDHLTHLGGGGISWFLRAFFSREGKHITWALVEDDGASGTATQSLFRRPGRAAFCHWGDAPACKEVNAIEGKPMTAENSLHAFREAVGNLSGLWLETALPSRQGLDEAALKLKRLREGLQVQGIWENPPTMVTATLDDGLGQGLAIIEKYAVVIGIRLISLGLMQTPGAVMVACRRHRPEFLGLTILQFDTEADLTAIAKNLPTETRIVAGGPVFKGDPDFAGRTGTHYAANNVADFLRFMLDSARRHP
jgi:hypothetical protein